MIRHIFLDADDTLFDFHLSERQALSETMRRFHVEPTEAILSRYSEINTAHWKLLEQKQITRAELKLRRYEQLIREMGLHLSAREVADCYEELLGKGHFFMEGAQELLKTLQESYRLYIVSNGYTKTQWGRLRSAGVESCFDRVFISQEIGFDKPDARFFEVCFSQIPNFRRREAVIVGDSLSSDIQGGRNAGIRTVWYNPKRKPCDSPVVPDFEIHRLGELPDLLKAME